VGHVARIGEMRNS